MWSEVGSRGVKKICIQIAVGLGSTLLGINLHAVFHRVGQRDLVGDGLVGHELKLISAQQHNNGDECLEGGKILAWEFGGLANTF